MKPWLAGIVAIALAGFVYMWFFGSVPITEIGGDQLVYNRLSINILEGHGFSQKAQPPFSPSIARTPGYPAFLTLIYAFFGKENFEAVRLSQIMLMLGSGLILFYIARLIIANWFVAFGSLVLCYFFPFNYSGKGVYGYLLTESLYMFLVNCTVLFAVLAVKNSRWRDFILMAIFCGLGSLTRPANLFLPLAVFTFVLLFMHQSFRRNIGRWFLFLLIVAAVTVPWTIRNYIVFHKFIPLSVSLSGLMYLSASVIKNPNFTIYPDADFTKNDVPIPENDLRNAREELRKMYAVFNYGGDGGIQIIEHDKELKKIGLKLIKKNPLFSFKLWFYRILGFWRLSDLANLINGITKTVNLLSLTAICLKLAFYAAVIFGSAAFYSNPLVKLLLVFPLYNMLIYTPFVPSVRYALPAFYYLILFFMVAVWIGTRIVIKKPDCLFKAKNNAA